MPFEMTDQGGGSVPSHFFDEIRFPAEEQIGLWKSNTTSGQQVGSDGTVPMSGSKVAVSSPIENFSPIGIQSVDWLELRHSTIARDKMKTLGIGGEEGAASLSETSRNSVNHHPKSWSNLSVQTACNSLIGNRNGINGIQSESSLFSSSLSDIFTRKLKLSGNDILSHQHFNTVVYHHGPEEPFESLKEIEEQTIGNLLPDEDDLFSGVIDDLGQNFQANTGYELEDFDLFSSSGGMELEGDDRLYAAQKNSDGGSASSVVGEHPYGEHPSRTLFVRNINSNVEDSELKAVFEQFGDIRTVYTACKHRGFVMISYYDIRAARNAMKTLQNKPLRRRKLDIHYSIPKDNPSEKDTNQGTLMVFNLDSSVSTEELQQIFGVYGEIREIRETPLKRNHKFIEFYDIRAAEAALRALNRSDVAGKQIKLASGGTSRFMLQSEQEQDERNLYQSPFDNISSGQIVSSGVLTSPVIAFTESHQNSSVPNGLHSPARVGSVGKQFGLHEPNLSLDEMKYGNQHPSLHSHSFPEYHDSLANGLPYNSPGTFADIASNVGTKIKDGLDNRHIHGVSSNRHRMEPTGGVFGSPRNGSFSLHGNPYVWNNSNLHQQHPSSPMVWPNSPSFLNGLHANRVPHMPGFPRVPPLMLNATSPAHHHIGSAPAVNPSLWDRQQHAYAGESPETSSFHLGSLGNGGFLGHSPSHHMDIASQNIFSHGGGNCIDMTKNVGIRSPQQMCHLFPGRNPMISMQSSFDASNDPMRNVSYRRNESNSNHADKKLYELDIDRILRGEDNRTTLMIKNIPNKYTSKMLLAAIDEHCRGTYDFIYLPIDFKNKCNVGYAFINMIDPRQIIPFHEAFNGKKWEKFNSEKVASLAYGRIQGKAALIAHFQNSSLMNEDKRCRPILFHTDGPNAGDPEPFPIGSNIRSRLGKPRTNGNEESNRQGFPSVSANTEESPNGSDSSGSS